MKYYIIAGEASGDLHASNLIRELKKIDPAAGFRCWGGDLMALQGAEIVKHIRDISYMGFAEVLANIRAILANIRFCKKDILKYQPDVLILIDYPGFNLKIAEFAKQNGIRVFYYISPQVWAWKQGRVRQIKRIVDRMFVILPFEKEFYAGHNYHVDFVGHPLLDAIGHFQDTEPVGNIIREINPEGKPLIALLPGSRKQEIGRMLSTMLHVIPHFPDCRFVVAATPNVPLSFYQSIIGSGNAAVVSGKTYDILSAASAAIVTSGTATLETALFGVPEMVCYRGSAVSYRIARRVIKVKYISLVNLILDSRVVQEFIQHDFTADNLVAELKKLLHDNPYRQQMIRSFAELKSRLGGCGASAKTARMIYDDLQPSGGAQP